MGEFVWDINNKSGGIVPGDLAKQIPPRPLGGGVFRYFGLGSCASPYRDAEGEVVTMELPAGPEELLAESTREAAADKAWIDDTLAKEVDVIIGGTHNG